MGSLQCVCFLCVGQHHTLPWLRHGEREREREREVNHNSCAPKRECGCAPQCLNHPARCCTHDFTPPHAHRQPVYMETHVTMNYSSASYLLCAAPSILWHFCRCQIRAGSYQFLGVPLTVIQMTTRVISRYNCSNRNF